VCECDGHIKCKFYILRNWIVKHWDLYKASNANMQCVILWSSDTDTTQTLTYWHW
jgi:hypothetical protein